MNDKQLASQLALTALRERGPMNSQMIYGLFQHLGLSRDTWVSAVNELWMDGAIAVTNDGVWSIYEGD